MSDRDRDFAALALRTAIGPMLILHGHNKVFGSGGLTGTTGWFESLGLRPAAVHARMAAATEMGAGALITLGAANPLPTAAVVGLMATAAATDHRGKGFFVFKGGWEYTAVVALAATALAGLGHGRWSIDRLLGRKERSGALMAVGAVVLGLAGAGALLASSYRPDQDESTEDSSPGSTESTEDSNQDSTESNEGLGEAAGADPA